MLDYIEFLNMPAKVAAVIVITLVVMNIVGEILEFKGKIVPEFVKMRKYFIRKRKEAEVVREVSETLKEAKAALAEFNSHYSTDNISKRDKWINWVNDRESLHDKSIEEIEKKVDKNNEIILSILIDIKRNAIIDFASKVIDEQYPVTREQFNRIFKHYSEYEDIIRDHHLTNGEVDIAHRIISESYEKHMLNHSFIEDIRGYKAK